MAVLLVHREHSLDKLQIAIKHMFDGKFTLLFTKIAKRVYSRRLFYGLKRMSANPFQGRKAKIEIKVRPLEERDIAPLLNTEGLAEGDVEQIKYQRDLINANLKTSYVAVDADDKPCYMQWLIQSSENEKVINQFKGLFPTLEPNEVLLEGAFMHPSYRGLGIMPDAMCQISEKAIELGAAEVITFVRVDNIASLKGCKSCGFNPYTLLKEQWFLFKRTVSFEPIPDSMKVAYKIATSSKLQQA